MVRVRVSKCNTTPVPQYTPGQKHTVLPVPLSFPMDTWARMVPSGEWGGIRVTREEVSEEEE